MGLVYKWKLSMYVCVSVITSKMINKTARRLHRPLKPYNFGKLVMKAIQKASENSNTKTNIMTKTTTKTKTQKVPETPNLCYIFEILMTHSLQI